MPVYQDPQTKSWYFSCYFQDWQGQRRRKVKRGYKLAREAKEAERDFLRQQAGDCQMSFNAMYELYMEDCKARNKASTEIYKASRFKSAIIPYFQSFNDITKITPADIRRWQNELIPRYAAGSLKKLHGDLSALFNFAVKFYGLKRNPASIAGNVRNAKAAAADFWTPAEFNKAMEQIDTLQLKAAFTLLFYSGLRIGELLALACGDYNRSSKTITVNKTMSYSGNGYIISTPKTKKSNRTITIPTRASSLLDEYIATLYEPTGKDTLFAGLGRSKIMLALKRAAAKAGVKSIRIHGLRHSHASMLINAGANIKAISERLGHTDIKTTLNTYGHLYKSADAAIAAMLDNIK